MRPGVIHDDHGSVRQITDSLMRFASFFDEIQFQFVTRHYRRPQGPGQVPHVQRLNLLQPRHLAERHHRS